MKSIFRTLALSATSLLFAVGSSHADCYRSAFKLESDKKEKNIDQILAYGQCVKAEQRARVGKWTCQVSKTAGMEVDEQRRVIGDHILVNARFFVTIKEVSDAEKRMKCDGSEYGLVDSIDDYHANRCLINYDVEFSPSMGNFLTTFRASMRSSRYSAQTISRSLRAKKETSLSRWELVKNRNNDRASSVVMAVERHPVCDAARPPPTNYTGPVG